MAIIGKLRSDYKRDGSLRRHHRRNLRRQSRRSRASSRGSSMGADRGRFVPRYHPPIIIADLKPNGLDALFDPLTQRAILPNLVFEQREIP
jgi:hypothetical protein